MVKEVAQGDVAKEGAVLDSLVKDPRLGAPRLVDTHVWVPHVWSKTHVWVPHVWSTPTSGCPTSGQRRCARQPVKEAVGQLKQPIVHAKSPGRPRRPLRPLKTSRSSRSSKHTRVAAKGRSIPESLRKAAGDVEVKEAVREQPGQRSC